MSTEEAGIKTQAQLLDTELNKYMSTRTQVWDLADVVKLGNKLTEDQIQKIQTLKAEVDRSEAYLKLNLRSQQLEFRTIYEQNKNVEEVVNEKLQSKLSEIESQNAKLQSQVDTVSELIDKRKQITDLLNLFISGNQDLELSKDELEKTFQGYDMEPVYKMGKRSGKIYRFKKLHLKESVQQLNAKIKDKEAQIQKLKANIREKKARWERLSKIIASNLESLKEDLEPELK
ncbi:BA75_02736T0 [Komagataella pastoris]|uniref:BA75_02736T0 n=1 Tax=Komagataella pastoris TaxID=4922 RepID=A0A1B2JCX2_PICPA|nr:BA75_02736T0 [Komagataella pastoris]